MERVVQERPALRGFQQDAAGLLVQAKKGILALPPGAGKTRTCLTALERIKPKRVLIVGSNISLATWKQEWIKWGIDEFLPEPTLTVGLAPIKRVDLWNNCPVIATTYAGLLQDSLQPKASPYVRGIALKQKFDVIICDEVHRATNRRKKFFKAVKAVCNKAPYAFLASGTIAKGGVDRVWSALHICSRSRYSSYWRFAEEFCIVTTTPFGLEVEGSRNVGKLVRESSDLMYYRSKKSILPEMPEKLRQKMPVQLTPNLRKLYVQLANDFVAELETEELLIAQNSLVASIRLRQLLCYPAMLAPSLGSGPAVQAMIEYMKDNEEHVVIFVPFRKAIPFIKQALEMQDIGPVYTLQGKMSYEEIVAASQGFKENRGVLIATIGMAESYSLETCDTAHFLGADWDPDQNYQAEDRIHRMTSKHKFVYYLYWAYENTIDDRVFEVLDQKQSGKNKFFRRANELREAILGTLKKD